MPLLSRIELRALERGRREAAVAFVMRALKRCVGEIEPALQVKIQQLSIDQLEALGEALLDFSRMEDLIAWLQTHPPDDRFQK